VTFDWPTVDAGFERGDEAVLDDRRRSMKSTAVFVMVVLALALAGPASAQSNGGIYQALAPNGAPVGQYFIFSVSGGQFVVGILTFGAGGNGRWFGAKGGSDGTNAGGQIISPSQFNLTEPAGASLQFHLDSPGAATGSYTTSGLGSLLPQPSGRVVRVFP
jgi:hypothetical protein